MSYPIDPTGIFTEATDESICESVRTNELDFKSPEREDLTDSEDTNTLGERLYTEGKMVEAIRCFKQVVENSSSDAFSLCRAFNNIGVISHNLNDIKTAEYMFNSALRIDNINLDALLNLSDLFMTQGRHEEALSLLEKALPAHPCCKEQISEKLVLCRKALHKIRKLHIGGKLRVDGWEILNAVDAPYVDHLGNAADLANFEDGTFQAVYSSHVLEHFDYLELEKVLREWKRVLVPGGIIYASVPDLDTIAALLIKRKRSDLEGQFQLMRMMFGGHIDKYDYHYTGLNQTILTHFLRAAGFIDIQKVINFRLFSDTSQMKVNGVAISLNMTAIKPAAQRY
ncbi:MAG: methyltransferase domain-containing protein [Pseudomonadota bacterium]